MPRRLTVTEIYRLGIATIAALAGMGYVAPGGWALGLSDGRTYELVSPAQKDGGFAGADSGGQAKYAYARADGDGLLFGTSGRVGAVRNAIDDHAVALRSTTGAWETSGVLPAGQARPNLANAEGLAVEPAADLSSIFFMAAASFAPGNPVIPGHEQRSPSVYVARMDGSVEWVGQPRIAQPDPELGEVRLTGNVNLAGAAVDLGVVYFSYYGTLVPEDEERGRLLAEHGGANAFPEDPGFYEWREGLQPGEGLLVSGGELPDGSYSRLGAEPASTGDNSASLTSDYHNQVSLDGARAFFVSPSAELCPLPPHHANSLCGGELPELYVRENGAGSVLISHDEAGVEAAHGVVAMRDLNPQEQTSFMFATPDGSRVFFESRDRLTGLAPEDGSVKMYMFDTGEESLTYLPEVGTSAGVPAATGASVLAVSDDGERMLFAWTGASGAVGIGLWTNGPGGGSVTPVAMFSAGGEAPEARSVAGGDVFAFQTNGTIVGGGFDSGGFEQVYRYDVAAGELACLSCPPAGVPPSGDAHLSTDEYVTNRTPLDSRGVSEDGRRVFFDSPDALVPGDVNGRRDVYEWEAGRVFLVSGGSGLRDSYFLDNSASGGDVFFTTSDGLVAADTDGGYDVYDARVGGLGEPPSLVGCSGDCQGEPSTAPVFGVPVSAAFSGPGNPVAAEPPVKSALLSKPKSKPKPAKVRKKRRRGRGKAGRARGARGGRR
jgi:hypothetical protein